MNFCIITVGYNRPESMRRLLNSVIAADYGDDKVDLFVSIDKGARQREIVAVAETVNWAHGEKHIRVFETRQGLKNHIINCGMLTEQYDTVVVLEDDITVSPAFYHYLRQAVDFYGQDDRIAGISLYTHRMNQDVRHFAPEPSGYDTYFVQYAQSWGQCWTRQMWDGFYRWYTQNEEWDASCSILPAYLNEWEHSWLKYFIKYIVMTDKYFVYPYYALSTNHSEAGEHSAFGIKSLFQVPMLTNSIAYRFPEFAQGVRYDVFFERQGIQVSGFEDKRICVDIYGRKRTFGDADLLISTAPRPYKVVATYGLKYRPPELNCMNKCTGNDIFAYDLSVPAAPPKTDACSFVSYDARLLSWREVCLLAKSMFLAVLKNKFFSRSK